MNDKPAKVVALEGMPGAGKTTFLESKKLRSGKQYLFLPQLEIDLAGIDKDDNLTKAERFIAAESEKAKSVQSARKGDIIFLDRSYISTLAFYYSYAQLTSKESDKVVYKHACDVFMERLKNNEIIKPDVMLVLNVSIAESLKRRKDFSHQAEYYPWFEDGFLKAMQYFYTKEIYKKFYDGKVIYLDTTGISAVAAENRIASILNI